MKDYSEYIGNLIGKDDLKTALNELCQLLKNSPRLDEAIVQSARYNDIMKQIRLGVVSNKQANFTKNQIRIGILQLLSEIEELAVKNEEVQEEVKAYQSKQGIHIESSKNIVVNSKLNAGRDITIGDTHKP